MKIELKNLKINERMSEETTCFSATVYVDGKRAFEACNRGHGGPNEYHGDYEAAQKYAASLPPYVMKEEGETCEEMTIRSLPYDLDMLIDDLINDAQYEKLIKRDLKYVAIVKDCKYYTTKAPNTPEMVAAVQKKYPTATILNTMPMTEVVSLLKSLGI